nr:hypothetical protein [uncultured Subdoligranulum sp.]
MAAPDHIAGTKAGQAGHIFNAAKQDPPFPVHDPQRADPHTVHLPRTRQYIQQFVFQFRAAHGGAGRKYFQRAQFTAALHDGAFGGGPADIDRKKIFHTGHSK